MKKIKTFRIFEAEQKERMQKFIALNSIGHYLDPEHGYVYAMLKAGGYESEPYPAEEELEENMDVLSQEERDQVNSVWKSCESVLSPALDQDLISDIKDIALAEEILDRGYHIRISVICDAIDKRVYTEWYGHDRRNDDEKFEKLFLADMRELQESDLDECLKYEVSVFKEFQGGYTPAVGVAEDVIEIIERIKQMHPEKAHAIEYSKW